MEKSNEIKTKMSPTKSNHIHTVFTLPKIKETLNSERETKHNSSSLN